MAKIVKKDNHLEKEYSQAKHGMSSNMAGFLILLAFSTICVFTYLQIEITTFLVVAAVLFLIGVVMLYSDKSADYSEQSILASGILGEEITADVLSDLPDNYTVYQDIVITVDGKKSEIDNIVVGRTGVFVIETKNHKSTITGEYDEREWVQSKVGRGGTPYDNYIYNPVKQVNTHIFRLKNLFRKNDIRVYINGIVYFSNPDAKVIINGASGDVPIFTAAADGEEEMLKYIMKGNANLSESMLRKINNLLK
jgi:Zn-dependent protease with chaperone function